MRRTVMKPVETLKVRDFVRLADDTRYFRVLDIDPPLNGRDYYRISLRSDDGLSTTLVRTEDDSVAVWVS
ncbi:MAG TPA: hypothetical protein VEA35_14015 [Ramlibacter sp.]|nr:hypothetical protein [Ramlibacter sp.]